MSCSHPLPEASNTARHKLLVGQREPLCICHQLDTPSHPTSLEQISGAPELPSSAQVTMVFCTRLSRNAALAFKRYTLPWDR